MVKTMKILRLHYDITSYKLSWYTVRCTARCLGIVSALNLIHKSKPHCSVVCSL